MENEAVHSLVAVELVAQSAAVLGGCRELNEAGQCTGRSGLLVSIQMAAFHIERIPLNTRVLTHCNTRQLLGNFRDNIGRVFIGRELIAEVNLQTVQLPVAQDSV